MLQKESIWVKEKHHKRPTQLEIRSDANIVKLIEMLIKDEDFSKYWTNPKPRDIDAKFNGESLQHDIIIGKLPKVTAHQCIVVAQDDLCKYTCSKI